MYCLEGDHVCVGRHVDDTCYEFFSIFYKSGKFWLHSNTRGSFVNVLLSRDVFLVCFVVFWILSWFFFNWRRLVWDTRLFFVEIVFFVFGGSFSISIESSFVTLYRRGSLWFLVVFSFDCCLRVFRIGLWGLVF